LVITGEGKIDNQTIHGKAPAGIAMLAKKYNIPVIAVTGQLESGSDELYELGFQVIMPIVDKPMTFGKALKSASFLLENTGERIARFIQLTKLIPAD